MWPFTNVSESYSGVNIKIQQKKGKRMKNSQQSFVTYSFFLFVCWLAPLRVRIEFYRQLFLVQQQQLSFNISFRNLLRKIRWSPHLSFFSFLSSTRPILRLVCVKLARQERSYDDVYRVLLLDSDELSATHGWFDSHTELGGVRGANLIVTGRRGGIHNR